MDGSRFGEDPLRHSRGLRNNSLEKSLFMLIGGPGTED
jgi:hypothetical protein